MPEVLKNLCLIKIQKKKNLEYLEIKKVKIKLIIEKAIKYVGLNSSCIYLLLFFTI